MSSSSVNRCIAIAAHGRRCQQSTYRGSPYCWHHTQSRKVWAPSRVSTHARAADAPVFALATPETPPPTPAIERIGARLNRGQLEQLARFLEAPGDGTLVIGRAHGYVEVRGSARPAFSAPGAQHGG
jgi:hypothetical protein